MSNRKVWFSISAAVLLHLNLRAQTPVLTLQQSIETAIANNLQVKQSGLQMEREGVYSMQAKANFLPAISGNIDHTLNRGRSIDLYTNSYINQEYTSAAYSLNASITVFNGLRLLYSLKSSQYAYEASRLEWQQSKERLMLDVILAYLQVLTNKDLLEQAYKQANVSQKQVERLEILHQQGAIKPADLYDMKGQLGDNKLAIINRQNDLDGARLSLAQLMNVPYDKNLQVQPLPIEQFDMQYGSTPDSIYQVAVQQLAQVKATELRLKSASKMVQAERGNLFPRVNVGGGYYTNFSSTARDSSTRKIPYYDQLSNNYSTFAGVGISIPILNGFRARNQVKLAKIDLKNAEYVAQTTQIQLKQNIERDYFNMIASLNKYQALIDQVSAYTASFHSAEVLFNAGAANSVDYVIAKNNLDRANTNLIIARYDYLLRTKILDYYQGKRLW